MTVDQQPEAAPVAPAPAPRPLWRNGDFLLLWGGDVVSSLGSQASQLALPLLMLAVTGSPAQSGLLSALRGASYLLFGLPAGALIDRWNRRAVMIGADTLRMLACLSILLALLTDRLTAAQLFVVSALEGVGFIAFGLAHTASFTRVVPKAQIPAALAQAQFLDSFARTAGPTLGGVIFAASRSLPFVADALSYLLSIGTVLGVRRSLDTEQVTAQRPRLGDEIAAGLAWLRGQPTLLALSLVNGAVNLIFGGLPLLVIALAQHLGAGAPTIGLLFTLGGIGTLGGAALSPWTLRRLTVGRLIVGSVWVFALFWPLYAFAPYPLVLGLTLGNGLFCAALYSSATLAYRLVVTPTAMQGRVIAVGRLLTYGGQAAGYLLMGLLIQRFGSVTTAELAFLPSVLLALLTTLSAATRHAPRIDAVETAPL